MSALEKAWQFDLNRTVADYSTVAQLAKSQLMGLKQFLTGAVGGATQGLWAVVQSCDSTQVKTDGTDLWTDLTKLVNSTGAHSWIVLKCSALNVWLTIDMVIAANNYPCHFVFSLQEPTGGSTSAKPTATNSWAHVLSGSNALNTNAAVAIRQNYGLAPDGSFYFVCVKNNSGAPQFFLQFHVLANTQVGDQSPYVSIAAQSMTNYSVHATTAAVLGLSMTKDTVSMYLQYPFAYPITTGQSLLDIIPLGGDPLSGKYPEHAIAIWDANGGVRGRIQDVYLTTKNGAAGTKFPADPAVQTHSQYGVYMLPSNGLISFA